MLVLRRIHTAYTLQASEEVRETVERVHDMHRDYCPVYRSIHRAIEVTTDFEIV